ncbi:MAG: LPS assembly protein LptD, partial [candidate division Zixibacteria bacterium]|nr:LPS assembly protein LptD [candidate division Zixibacteria bacterium]
DTPVLYDGEEQITGQRMVYNLSTREGKILTGKTKFEKGFYYGQKFYKVGENEFLASRGYFTTCDLTPPHFHFFSSKMKLIPEDKIIAQPLVLEIADVPIAGLPFYVFPIKPDRHSGFLTFEIGNFTGLNRFVRNLGYYWAFSEYMDVEAAMDIYEEEGIVLRGLYRYAVRNLLSGYVSGSFKRQSSWNLFNYTLDRSYRWDLNFSHSHQISETVKLAGSGTFLSDNSYYRDFNLNPVERRNRVLRSQINLSKRWSQAGGNLALEQNSDLDRNTETWLAPAFNFNKFSTQLFPVKTSETSVTPRWYNLIYYSFNSNWRNFISTAEDTAAGVDSTKHYLTADQRGSISFNPKLFGFLNLKPQMRFQESWYYVFSTNQSDNAQILTGKLAGRGSVNFSLDASTNLYGTFPVSVLGLQGIRHVFTPAVSYSWQPETDQHAQLRSFTGIGPFSSKSQVMGFSAGNVFLIKTKSERKLEMFSLIFGSSYNFLATSHKLGNLRTSLRSAAVPNVDFQFNAEHDFYDPAGLNLSVFNPRLLNFDVNTNINLQRSASAGLDTSSADYAAARKGWRVYLSHRYSENKILGAFGRNHWMGINSEFWATANWKINYSARYDFINREMAEQIVEIYRDLHCWEARISWIPSGFREGFYFRINIKALPEIKFEKGGAGLGSAFY